MKRILTFLLTLTVLFSNISISKLDTYAADGTVKIFLGDNDTPRHHISINIGEESETISYSVNDDVNVDKGTFVAEDFKDGQGDSVTFKITQSNKTCKISGLKEGTGVLSLNITTKS